MMTPAKRQQIRDLLASVKLRLFFERVERRQALTPPVIAGNGERRGYDGARDEREFYRE